MIGISGRDRRTSVMTSRAYSHSFENMQDTPSAAVSAGMRAAISEAVRP
jgi:hypothetical protein